MAIKSVVLHSPTPLHYLFQLDKNVLYIKRDDLLPFAFGGNKARKATYFLKEILEHSYNVVVTYGSQQSNHCRVIATLCANHNLKCLIISPLPQETTQKRTNFNRSLITLSQAQVIETPLSQVATTIQATLKELKQNNFKPYFIPGGGHGNLGTQAYVDAYEEIAQAEKDQGINFDYIFLASGTGTTQAGLILGSLQHKAAPQIIGISIARSASHGSQVIQASIQEYLDARPLSVSNSIPENWQNKIHFTDQYVEPTYGQANKLIRQTIRDVYLKSGIALSSCYTGKAFLGMTQFIQTHQLRNKTILFIHTGAVPLFFNDLTDLEAII